MLDRLLICTDLDRTLMPNGAQPESPQARQLFSRLAARSEVQLAYVTGRHRELVEHAIAEYQLPYPDFVIGDVGTSIFTVEDSEWKPWSAWYDILAEAWGDTDGPSMIRLFDGERELTPQESEKQGRFKCSFYSSLSVDIRALQRRMQARLDSAALASHIVWSIDDNRQIGLIDVLPQQASKLHALRFLMQQTGFDLTDTLFAGDSGNDLEVLTSDVPAVLVANATDPIRTQARQLCSSIGTSDAFYAAHGGFRGMNGNYSAGILEGLVHFLPETDAWIDQGD